MCVCVYSFWVKLSGWPVSSRCRQASLTSINMVLPAATEPLPINLPVPRTTVFLEVLGSAMRSLFFALLCPAVERGISRYNVFSSSCYLNALKRTASNYLGCYLVFFIFYFNLIFYHNTNILGRWSHEEGRDELACKQRWYGVWKALLNKFKE